MNTIECIKYRRSVRSFLPVDVENEKLNEIMLSGLEAPTAMNSRQIALTVIRGERLKKLNQAIKATLNEQMLAHFTSNGEFNFYRGGNALIVVSLGKESVLPEQNVGCIMENMYLAATELNLGACWINMLYKTKDENVLKLLELEDGYVPYAALSVGYVDVLPEKKERSGIIKFLD